jgi:NAD(P)-dependent dehydrogenase (short-subunit alcohol dehydrogenase family)
VTDIAGKVAVVTGGGSGLGRGLALALAAEGARVVVADILEHNASAVAREIVEVGGNACAVACDVSDFTSVRLLKEKANQAFGPVSLLFANAGVDCLDPLTQLSHRTIEWVIHVNLLGVTYCVESFLPDMIAARGGHVVATASIVGILPSWLPHHAPYVASKAGVIGLMLNLREELKASGVGCTVLCPGGVVSHIAESPRYRPPRFGGPIEVAVTAPSNFQSDLKFRSPAEVAQMTLLGMRQNRAIIITDPAQRQRFLDGYVAPLLTAFDDATAFDEALIATRVTANDDKPV